ncbi:conserved hypothetical protein [Coccidioides posadasii str. Silveira]|uniref:Uncharacterized protein n=1 Tax=Coccidioides posadasii (strain RMSCC 757 / Silveira) TaxID=443226 RepID=E9CZQ9_COCPS|nr:conserved hypothetical protein [Coccidioides posadasii str. Silveira]
MARDPMDLRTNDAGVGTAGPLYYYAHCGGGGRGGGGGEEEEEEEEEEEPALSVCGSERWRGGEGGKPSFRRQSGGNIFFWERRAHKHSAILDMFAPDEAREREAESHRSRALIGRREAPLGVFVWRLPGLCVIPGPAVDGRLHRPIRADRAWTGASMRAHGSPSRCGVPGSFDPKQFSQMRVSECNFSTRSERQQAIPTQLPERLKREKSVGASLGIIAVSHRINLRRRQVSSLDSRPHQEEPAGRRSSRETPGTKASFPQLRE